MGIAGGQSPGKIVRKTALSLVDYEKVSYWMDIPIRDFQEWIQDVIELTEERRKHE